MEQEEDIIADKKETEQKETEKSIHAILYLLETQLQKHMEQVEEGRELLKVGSKNELVETIEKALKAPGKQLLKAADKIDLAIASYTKLKLESYFSQKKERLVGVWYSEVEFPGQLHYVIALKKDSMESREEFFHFLDKYEDSDFSRRLPIHFHFVDKEDVNTMKAGEPVSLK